jgi:hypothetical protein
VFCTQWVELSFSLDYTGCRKDGIHMHSTDEVTIASGAVSTNNVRLWIEAKEMVGWGHTDSRVQTGMYYSPPMN